MHSRTTLLLAIFVVFLVQAAFALVSQTPAFNGQLTGPDAYMRLHRVMVLFETGNWYGAFNLRTNAPFGEQLHWTRPLDSILFAGAWIGSAVTDFPRALLAWGVIIGPATLLLLVPIWSWGTRALLSPGAFILSLAIIVIMPLLNGVFLLGRPDHHGLLALSFLSMIAIFVRLTTGQSQARSALVGGVIAGTALWVSVEALAAAAYFGAALALLWVWRESSHGRHISSYLVGLFAAVTIALLIERPPDQWLSPFYERISVVHWFLTITLVTAWFSAMAIAPRLPVASGRACRIAILVAVGVVTILAMAIVFPKFFQGPLIDFRSPAFDEWMRTNTEVRPFWPISRLSLSKFLANLGPAIVALGYMGLAWKSASAERRNVFAILLLGYVVYVPLTLFQLRWASYVQALTLIPLVMTLVGVWRWNGAVTFAGRAIHVRSLLAALIATGPFIAFSLVAGTGASSTQAVSARVYHGCDRVAISEHLSQIHAQGSPDDILFTYSFWGSELIWRTPYSVVGAPYGNTQSLSDTKILFGATSDDDAVEVVRRRGIDLILICTEEIENSQYDKVASTFFNRLTEDPPAWLAPVGLPNPLASTFRLYRVDAENLPRQSSDITST